MIQRLALVAGVFFIGMCVYLLLGGLGLVQWHRDQGTGPGPAIQTESRAISTWGSRLFGSQNKPRILNSFETKKECQVLVGGYTEIEQSTQPVSHGKFSLKAVFLLRSQFYPSPNPEPTPLLNQKSNNTDKKPAITSTPRPAWKPRILWGQGSVVRLPITNWSEFRSLKLDIFNPDKRAINVTLEIADSRGFVFMIPAGGLPGEKISVVGADLKDLADQDLDLTRIRHVALHVDVTGRGTPPTLYLDFLRLEH